MKHNYSYAGIAVALKNGCRLTACTRQVDQLNIVEVSLARPLALNKGLWLRSFAQSPFLEGALDLADAAFCYHLPEWWQDPKGLAQHEQYEIKNPDSPLDCWLKLGGSIALYYENGSYELELSSTGAMPPGWRVLHLTSQSRLGAFLGCANEVAKLELAKTELPDLRVQIVAG